jgi:hypothetical protein
MKWMFWSTATAIVGLGFATGCSSSGGSEAPGTDGGSDKDVGTDASAGDSAKSTVLGCYTLSGSGSTKKCAFASSTSGSGSQSSKVRCDAGETFGSCPTSGLNGCCVVTPPDAGGAITATCYYAPDAGRAEEEVCNTQLYEGFPDLWQTTVP